MLTDSVLVNMIIFLKNIVTHSRSTLLAILLHIASSIYLIISQYEYGHFEDWGFIQSEIFVEKICVQM